MRLPFPVVLASGSPRRRELLARLVPEFEVVVPDVDEAALAQEDPWGTAESLALAKAKRVAESRRQHIVIGGDTVVAVACDEGETRFAQLGKPADAAEARAMLRRLSGRSHLVITGVAVCTPHGSEVFSETSRVRFRELGDPEIDAYAASGEPMDKAGAYAIQGGAAAFVESVEGSFSNVVGLPVEALAERLERYAAMVDAAQLPKSSQTARDCAGPADKLG